MNWIEFVSLLRMIYGNKKLDIQKIQKMGLLAVKIGQAHALRIDLLNPDKCAELTKLYRHNIVVPPEELLKLVDRSKFSKIEEHAIASASIGQVYEARLFSGDRVIIKIVKQDYRKRFVSDVASVKKFFRIGLFFYPKLKKVFDPVGIIEHIEEYTLAELDLRKEIQGQKILSGIIRDNKNRFDLSAVGLPKIYEELSNENVLVSEFIDGATFDELLDKNALPYEVLLEFFRIHGFCMFTVGTFHGDVHPGNMILKGDKIYLVDTGAISTVSEKLKSGLFNFFDALSWYDYGNCALCLNQMSDVFIEGNAFARFKDKFFELYRDFEGAPVSKVSLTKKMMETIKLGVNSGMRFSKGMFPIIKSLMFLDGMVLRCNPQAVLLKDMRRYLKEFKTGLSRF